MGNRAVISMGPYSPEQLGIYVHWNGGRDSIEGFLKAAREIMCGCENDVQYGRARLIQAVTTFFNGNLSVGIGICAELDCDNWDNGVYEIDMATLEIVGRHHFKQREQTGHDSEMIAQSIIRKIKKGESENNDA